MRRRHHQLANIATKALASAFGIGALLLISGCDFSGCKDVEGGCFKTNDGIRPSEFVFARHLYCEGPAPLRSRYERFPQRSSTESCSAAKAEYDQYPEPCERFPGYDNYLGSYTYKRVKTSNSCD